MTIPGSSLIDSHSTPASIDAWHLVLYEAREDGIVWIGSLSSITDVCSICKGIGNIVKFTSEARALRASESKWTSQWLEKADTDCKAAQ